MATLSGTWLGTYWQDEDPTRFEATFVQSGNALSGNILDDGKLGEAQLQGEVVGRTVQFTKRYLNPGLSPIFYTGTIAEDENSIQGDWVISGSNAGRWEAHRNAEDLMASLRSRLATTTSLAQSNR
jgi:hypothetical protein